MRLSAAAAVCLSLATFACGGKPAPEGAGGASPAAGGGGGGAGKPVKVGFSMDTLKEERWQRDRDLVKKYCEDHGATVLVQAANGNDALQNSQAENGFPHPHRSSSMSPRRHRWTTSPSAYPPGSSPRMRSRRVVPLRPSPPMYRTRVTISPSLVLSV